MTSNGEIKYLGVTPPISTEPPKPADLQSSEALLADLISLSQFESEAERKVRERLLSNIAQLVSKFVHDVSIKQGMSEKVASEAGGRIYTSGSYRLGVHGPGSDIDTICVCPRHIFREHFFGEFRQMLRDWPAVTEISAVESAFVPLIKTVISGVEVDLLFARVNLAEAGDKLDIEKDEILRGVDDASQRSLNGPRVTDMILNLVPDVAVFRTALRAIRLWAKRRGIYSNILGFPGGVAWSLLLARICQLYPTAAPAVIVGKFFPIYYQWRWPDPVVLKKIEQGPSNMQHPVWNPRLDRRDQAHRMPVITPAYPSMCSTHNITASTMSVCRDEMLRAMQITDRILANPGSSWVELFEKVDFFSLYKTYVQVIASASSSENIKDWGGMVESRVRTLVQDLENTDIVVTAHPLIYGIPMAFLCLTEEEQAAASQGELSEAAMKRTEADMEGKEYKKVWTKSFFVGLEIEKKAKDSSGSRVLNLFYPSKRFCAACQSWDKYDEMEMSVTLRPAKKTQLPFYCFPDGQPKGKKKTKRGPQPGALDAAGGDDSMDGQGPSKRPKSALGSDDSPLANGTTLTSSSIPIEETPGATPLIVNVSTPQPLPPISTPSTAQTASLPLAGAADPTPTPTNGAAAVIKDMLPPPAIEGMKPLSSESMAGFASAAKGVTTEAEAAKGSNEAGLVVLNGAS